MQRLVLVIGILALAVGTILFVKSRTGFAPGGSKAKKNNLADIQCLSVTQGASYPGHTDIPVNAQNGISIEYEAVFACAGEKVRWVAGTGVTAIEVSFPSANEWPFVDNFTSPIPMHGNHTDDQTVKGIDPKFRMRAFKYKVHVETTGSPVPDLDPHFMPM
jgi:hypothetical protein